MKILFSSYRFYPSVGGIESVSRILAEQFVAAGHQVDLITQSPSEEKIAELRYGVTRRPSLPELFRLLRWCDLLFQNNISLRNLLVALLLRKPALVVHQTWIRNVRGEIGWNARLKRALLPFVTNVAISQAVADDLKTAAVVIRNPYDDNIFRDFHSADRNRDLIFVGRLVSDKGVDVLLTALSILRDSGIQTQLTIVGDGLEHNALESQVRDLKLQSSVEFLGRQTGVELAKTLNRHRILVVPSRWPEPFGIVALEAIACGCVIVGSDQGGLSEAIGPCGITFPNNNADALARSLSEVLTNQARRDALISHANAHLANFSRTRVAQAYLELLNSGR